jgi:hypothetical protein
MVYLCECFIHICMYDMCLVGFVVIVVISLTL